MNNVDVDTKLSEITFTDNANKAKMDQIIQKIGDRMIGGLAFDCRGVTKGSFRAKYNVTEEEVSWLQKMYQVMGKKLVFKS